MVKPCEEQSANKKFYRNMLEYANYFSYLGEIVVVCRIISTNLSSNIAILCENPTGGAYGILNPPTNNVGTIDDVVWMKNTYGYYVASFQYRKKHYCVFQYKDESDKHICCLPVFCFPD